MAHCVFFLLLLYLLLFFFFLFLYWQSDLLNIAMSNQPWVSSGARGAFSASLSPPGRLLPVCGLPQKLILWLDQPHVGEGGQQHLVGGVGRDEISLCDITEGRLPTLLPAEEKVMCLFQYENKLQLQVKSKA